MKHKTIEDISPDEITIPIPRAAHAIDRPSFADDSECFAEWMRTSTGGTAALCCMAAENRDAPLYAYAYVHAVLSFFRRYECEKLIQLPPHEIAELLLEKCTRTARRLDLALYGCSNPHPLPHFAGFFTTADQRLAAFAAGTGTVAFQQHNDLHTLSVSAAQLRIGGEYGLSEAPQAARAVRMELPCDLSDTERITLTACSDSADSDALQIDLCYCDRNDGVTPFRALVTGKRHSSRDSGVCQDYGDFRRYPHGSFAAALSDGAGGANLSQYGARMNVAAFLDCADGEAALPDLAEGVLAEVSRRHIALQTDRPRRTIEAFATLMGVRIRGDTLEYLHIGDGAIFARKSGGGTVCLSDPENFHALNRTFFTISPDAAQHLDTGTAHRNDYEMLLMVTDGVYCADGTKRPLALIDEIFDEAAAPCFDEIRLAALIDGRDVSRRGDDQSAILLDLRQPRMS